MAFVQMDTQGYFINIYIFPTIVDTEFFFLSLDE